MIKKVNWEQQLLGYKISWFKYFTCLCLLIATTALVVSIKNLNTYTEKTVVELNLQRWEIEAIIIQFKITLGLLISSLIIVKQDTKMMLISILSLGYVLYQYIVWEFMSYLVYNPLVQVSVRYLGGGELNKLVFIIVIILFMLGLIILEKEFNNISKSNIGKIEKE